MAKQIKSVGDVHDYLAGLVERTGHHAEGVADVIFPIAGLVLTVAEPDSIWARTYRGEVKNACTFEVARETDGEVRSFVLAYDHEQGKISLRAGSYRDGIEIAQFDNNTPLREIRHQIMRLKQYP